MWHQWFNCNFMKLRDYFLCTKKTKITTLFNNSSPQHHPIEHHFGEYHVRKQRMQRMYVATLFTFRSKRKQRIRIWCYWHRTAYVYLCDTLQNGAIGRDGGDELLNKFVSFVFFVHKKYSRSFIKLQLNHWCHIDYFNNLLATFLDLDRVRILAVYGGSESSWNASKILILAILSINSILI